MKSKLMWFYQDMEEQEMQVNSEASNKPSTSRTLQASSSRTNLLQSVPVIKKKLFLTDGWDVPLTGICIYIFRTNTAKQLPEEGFQKVGIKTAENIPNRTWKLLRRHMDSLFGRIFLPSIIYYNNMISKFSNIFYFSILLTLFKVYSLWKMET